ncbi:MAG: hypothetical protein WC755_02385 [Candidatus Woesearchaeota archaeon]|jgi:hypothetical protein
MDTPIVTQLTNENNIQEANGVDPNRKMYFVMGVYSPTKKENLVKGILTANINNPIFIHSVQENRKFYRKTIFECLEIPYSDNLESKKDDILKSVKKLYEMLLSLKDAHKLGGSENSDESEHIDKRAYDLEKAFFENRGIIQYYVTCARNNIQATDILLELPKNIITLDDYLKKYI